jgi:hypothetical protein
MIFFFWLGRAAQLKRELFQFFQLFGRLGSREQKNWIGPTCTNSTGCLGFIRSRNLRAHESEECDYGEVLLLIISSLQDSSNSAWVGGFVSVPCPLSRHGRFPSSLLNTFNTGGHCPIHLSCLPSILIPTLWFLLDPTVAYHLLSEKLIPALRKGPIL